MSSYLTFSLSPFAPRLFNAGFVAQFIFECARICVRLRFFALRLFNTYFVAQFIFECARIVIRLRFSKNCAPRIIKNTLSKLLFVFLILTSLLNLFSNARVLLYAYASQKIVRLVIIKNTLSNCSIIRNY